jgi:hypothetical protein
MVGEIKVLGEQLDTEPKPSKVNIRRAIPVPEFRASCQIRMLVLSSGRTVKALN